MNTWQFHLWNWQGTIFVWAVSVSFVYTGLLVWAFIHTGLHITEIFSVTCILLSVSFHGLTIRAVLGNNVILSGWKERPGRPELLGGLNWRGSELIWKGERQTTLHTMNGLWRKAFHKALEAFCVICYLLTSNK